MFWMPLANPMPGQASQVRHDDFELFTRSSKLEPDAEIGTKSRFRSVPNYINGKNPTGL